MSELQAAMGLAVLPYMDEIIKDRKRIVNIYRKKLSQFQLLKIRDYSDWNNAYFSCYF